MKTGIAFLALYAVIIGGWIANIVKLINHAGPVAEWGAFEIARVVGIVAVPLGAVLGYL